eukprot:scaffold2626_cov141-Amphora_coffeaeformis.AAC.2
MRDGIFAKKIFVRLTQSAAGGSAGPHGWQYEEVIDTTSSLIPLSHSFPSMWFGDQDGTIQYTKTEAFADTVAK